MRPPHRRSDDSRVRQLPAGVDSKIGVDQTDAHAGLSPMQPTPSDRSASHWENSGIPSGSRWAWRTQRRRHSRMRRSSDHCRQSLRRLPTARHAAPRTRRAAPERFHRRHLVCAKSACNAVSSPLVNSSNRRRKGQLAVAACGRVDQRCLFQAFEPVVEIRIGGEGLCHLVRAERHGCRSVRWIQEQPR